jgi:hypothetical protein
MPTMTLSVPDDLYKVIKHHNEIKWSVIARNAMWEYARKIQLVDTISFGLLCASTDSCGNGVTI